jgi:hypothetical protein
LFPTAIRPLTFAWRPASTSHRGAGPSHRDGNRHQHLARKTCRRVLELVIGMPHHGWPSRQASPPPRRLRHTTLNIRKRWLHAASPSTCASARGRKSLAAFPSSSVLKARRVVASPCTYASSHGCLIPSCTNPAAVAFPHRTPKAGVKSFTIRFREPRGCALRHLSRTLLRGAAFRRSSTVVALTVCPTVTAEPPARVPSGVCAA